MTEIILVDKSGDLKQLKIKNFTFDDLYKKCKFRKSVGFEKRTVWAKSIDGDKIRVELWARNTGKANTENKYDFPPPVDTELYFGSCALVAKDKDNDVIDLSLSTWNKLYEKLFGGFEDLSASKEEDEEEEDELDEIPDDMKTKSGYLKDGFVVDDSDVDTSISEEDIDDSIENVSHEDDDEDSDNWEDNASELSSESYEYSD